MSDIVLNYTIPENVQDNLKKVMMKFKETGIWGSALQKEYKKIAKEELLYSSYGYGSILHMCTSLEYIFTIVKHMKGDFKLFDPNGNVPENLDILPKEDYQLCPGVLGYDDVIPRQLLVPTNNKIPIKICEVNNPSKFWFYNLDAEKKLAEVLNRMEEFYTTTKKNYLIPSYQMKTQLYCVVFYRMKFHRAIIVNLVPELVHSVKVFFIDYGTVDLTYLQDVYFLHEMFADHKALAMKAQLAFIKPCGLNMPWSKETTDAFINLVCNRHLQAQVESREEKGTVYVLKIFDNAHDKKYWIHEQLLEKKLAIMNSDTQDADLSLPEMVNNTEQMHLMPPFADLENGVAPTKSELDLLYSMGYPLQKIFEKYLKF